MKKLLIISSDFPPLCGTNTQRIQSFVRYLPHYDWSTVVVTRSVDDLPLIDGEEAQMVFDQCEIVRVVSPDIFKWRARLNGIKPVDVQRNKAKPDNLKVFANNTRASSNGLFSFLSKLLHLFFQTFIYRPDAEMPWAISASIKSIFIIKKSGLNIFLTSAPTYSTLVAGLIVKIFTQTSWLADFRDLWIGRPGRVVSSRYALCIDKLLERAVVRFADKIILASPAWVNVFIDRYGEQIKQKIVVITNGYDLTKLPITNDKSIRNKNVFRIVLTGSMHAVESPAPFIEALGVVYNNDPSLLKNVKLRLIGYPGEEKKVIDRLITTYGLNDIVIFLGVQSHVVCLHEQRQADLLLLCQSLEHKDTICAKSYEYMASGKPIFACVSLDGMVAGMLEQCGCARLVDYGDLSGTVEQLQAILATRKVSINPDFEYVSQFDRKKLVGLLVNELNTLVYY